MTAEKPEGDVALLIADLHSIADENPIWRFAAKKLESQSHRIQELEAALREVRSKTFEEAATLITTGKFCRYVEHCQDYCDCGGMAKAIRALSGGLPTDTEKRDG